MTFKRFAVCSLIQPFQIASPPTLTLVGFSLQVLFGGFFKGFAARFGAEVITASLVFNTYKASRCQ